MEISDGNDVPVEVKEEDDIIKLRCMRFVPRRFLEQ